MIYGLNISIDTSTNTISKTIDIPNWVPSRDGLYIELNSFKINNYSMALKLYLNYNEKQIQNPLGLHLIFFVLDYIVHR